MKILILMIPILMIACSKKKHTVVQKEFYVQRCIQGHMYHSLVRTVEGGKDAASLAIALTPEGKPIACGEKKPKIPLAKQSIEALRKRADENAIRRLQQEGISGQPAVPPAPTPR